MVDVAEVVRADLCTGCGLCAGISRAPKAGAVNPIEMREDAAGFLRPVVHAAPSSQTDAAIAAGCAGIRLVHRADLHDAPYHPQWGPVVEARLGWSRDPALRHQASSGGGVSALLLHLIESGEIDYALHTAVSPVSPLRNALHCSRGRDDVSVAAGSRYAPSSPLADIGERLDSSQRFAFVGKPCDVAALRQLARIDPRVDEKVPYMIAFFCAGVPSYRGTSALLKAMGVEDESEVTSFRYRGDGWPGFARAVIADGRKFAMDYDTSWGRILNRHLQFRCKICPDGVGEFADVVCADGWYCDEDGNPLFEEREGRSVILSRTRKGEELVTRAVASGHLAVEALDLDTLARMQPFQARRKGLVFWRLLAMALMGRRRPQFKGLALRENGRRLGLKAGLRSFLGAMKRIVCQVVI